MNENIIVGILAILACIAVYWIMKQFAPKASCEQHKKHDQECLPCVKAYAKQKGYEIIYTISTNTYHIISQHSGSCNLQKMVEIESDGKLDYELFKTEQETKQQHPKADPCGHCVEDDKK